MRSAMKRYLISSAKPVARGAKDRDGAALVFDKNYDAEASVEGLQARGVEPACGDQRDGEQERQGSKDHCPQPGRGQPASVGLSHSANAFRMLRLGQDGGRVAQVRVRGLDKVHAVFVFAMAAYDIVRLPKFSLPAANCVRPA